MPEYESFTAAEQALDNFSGWDTDRGIRPMTPHERSEAKVLLKQRREDVAQRGKDGIAIMRKGVQERGQSLVGRYQAAEQLFDGLDADIDGGLVSVTDLESALADAAMLERELGKQTDAHLAAVAQVEKDQDPEQVMLDLYQRYPELRRNGRVSPWVFNW